MKAQDDKEYMEWWNYYGEMSDPAAEYPAWKAGRAFQHLFEKNLDKQPE